MSIQFNWHLFIALTGILALMAMIYLLRSHRIPAVARWILKATFAVLAVCEALVFPYLAEFLDLSRVSVGLWLFWGGRAVLYGAAFVAVHRRWRWANWIAVFALVQILVLAWTPLNSGELQNSFRSILAAGVLFAWALNRLLEKVWSLVTRGAGGDPPAGGLGSAGEPTPGPGLERSHRV